MLALRPGCISSLLSVRVSWNSVNTVSRVMRIPANNFRLGQHTYAIMVHMDEDERVGCATDPPSLSHVVHEMRGWQFY